MQIVRKSAFKATSWKNGGGITHEALRVPTTGETFRWRISVAEVGASGPFSDFAGYRRIMVLLRGAGVRLQLAAAAAPIWLRKPGDLIEFDGGIATHCELLDGACTDFNLIVANAIGTVSARVLQLTSPVAVPLAAGVTLVVFVVAGSVSLRDVAAGAVPLRDAPPALLMTWDLAVVAGAADRRLELVSHDAQVRSQVFLASFYDTQ